MLVQGVCIASQARRTQQRALTKGKRGFHMISLKTVPQITENKRSMRQGTN